jgi:hypothetical protein
LFHPFFFPPFFYLSASGGIFYPAAYAGKPSWAFLATKKEWSSKGFHSILRVAIHKSVPVPGSYAHAAETKKVPKDCHAHTWYPLTLLTILNSVCSGLPPYRQRQNLQLTENADVPDIFIPDTS